MIIENNSMEMVDRREDTQEVIKDNNGENFNKDIADSKYKRIRSVISELAFIVGILVLNSIVYVLTGYGIPCVFRLVTGFKCPGCGLTHAYLELFKGNIHGAMEYNIMSVTMMPVLGLFLFYKGIILLKTGEVKIKKWENVFLIICAIIIVLFFIYRNIPELLNHPIFKMIISKK